MSWSGGAVLGLGAMRSWKTETRHIVKDRPEAWSGSELALLTRLRVP
jgi:hypothetical protein